MVPIPMNSMTQSLPNKAVTNPAEVVVTVDDFQYPGGWRNTASSAQRARQCCENLEAGKILFLKDIPYNFPAEDREFLLSQRQTGSRLHKNVSYRPLQDVLRGSAGDKEDVERLHGIMRRYSTEVQGFLRVLLAPYAKDWALDYASFRPEEEKGRDLSVHKRNDLLHFDAFPTRPMHGRRILRCFTNVNPTQPRLWRTTESFPTLATKYAAEAGLPRFAAEGSEPSNAVVRKVKKMFGFKAVDHSAYDRFMLNFHDFLKEKTDFQENCEKIPLEFPPGSTWICFTDSVAHAVLGGQYALEQTFIISLGSLVHPEQSPVRVLEKIAGAPLLRATA
jgi:3-deoxy-D-manno-oct-2-ulosonic acid (Kdo) hydroxylase